jgi:hypothetical protein
MRSALALLIATSAFCACKATRAALEEQAAEYWRPAMARLPGDHGSATSEVSGFTDCETA